ncbi:MAG: hypothetical protein LUD68_09430 [Rikenellaceae bacterium]|nr:hypothetical protein [Rikenellaceae bacterium]
MRQIKNVEDLVRQLKFIITALENTTENSELSSIEYDIILDKLRNIYESLWTSELTGEISSPGNSSAEVPAGRPEQTSANEAAIVSSVQTDAVPATIEELIEKPFTVHPAVDKSIIESLYGEEVSSGTQPESPAMKTEVKEGLDSPADTRMLHETLAAPPAMDVATMLSAQTCGLLRQKIGYNDRTMLLQDLFENDELLYERTLDALDEAQSLDDAYIYLYENFTLDNEKEGVKLLIALLEAKFN